MSAIANTSPAAASGFARAIVRAVLRPLATWRARQLALAELEALDDHMLADIGISRGEIPGIISGAILPNRAVNENEASQVA